MQFTDLVGVWHRSLLLLQQLPGSEPRGVPLQPSQLCQRCCHPTMQDRHKVARRPDQDQLQTNVRAVCSLYALCQFVPIMQAGCSQQQAVSQLAPRWMLTCAMPIRGSHAIPPKSPSTTGLLTDRLNGLLSTSGAFSAASMGSAASAPLKGVVVYNVEYTALGLAARASSRDGVLPSPEPPCAGQQQRRCISC